MAWYLEQAGETLALLAIFDQPTPHRLKMNNINNKQNLNGCGILY